MTKGRCPTLLVVLVLAFWLFTCAPAQFVEDLRFGEEDINPPDEVTPTPRLSNLSHSWPSSQRGAWWSQQRTLIRVPRRDESDVQKWSYDGNTGPEYWASLIPTAYQCRHGTHLIFTPTALNVLVARVTHTPCATCVNAGTLQSPINIETSRVHRQYDNQPLSCCQVIWRWPTEVNKNNIHRGRQQDTWASSSSTTAPTLGGSCGITDTASSTA